MGCGKSSIGRKLSELLCCPYIDLDSVIEEMVGRSIPEIFAKDGEAVFRQMETDALRIVLSDGLRVFGRSLRSPHHCASLVVPPLSCRGWHGPHNPQPHQTEPPYNHSIISLGGGTVMTRECAEMVMENTICIYLRASVDTLVTNLKDEADGRPMLQSSVSLRERIEELMSQRADTYEKTSHIVVDTDGKSIDEIATVIITHPLFQQMR